MDWYTDAFNALQRQNIIRLLDSFACIFPESPYGPMHILIDDYNCDDDCIAFCRGYVRGMLNEDATPEEIESVKDYAPHDIKELRASLLLLDMLLLMPEEWRDPDDDEIVEEGRNE